MSTLDTRINRLEEKLGKNREPRVIIITINPNNFPEDPYRFELLSGNLWAYAARGDPFTAEELTDSETSTGGSKIEPEATN